MIGEKYIGLDVHQATISVAVMDSKGKVVMESILETQAATILEFFAGLRGTLWVTFEEGTWATIRRLELTQCFCWSHSRRNINPAHERPILALNPASCMGLLIVLPRARDTVKDLHAA